MKISIHLNGHATYKKDFDDSYLETIQTIIRPLKKNVNEDGPQEGVYLLTVAGETYALFKEEMETTVQRLNALHENFFTRFALPRVLHSVLPQSVKRQLGTLEIKEPVQSPQQVATEAMESLGFNLSWAQYYLDNFVNQLSHAKQVMISGYHLKSKHTGLRLLAKYKEFKEPASAQIHPLHLSKEEIEAAGYRKKKVDPNGRTAESKRYQQLLDIIAQQQQQREEELEARYYHQNKVDPEGSSAESKRFKEILQRLGELQQQTVRRQLQQARNLYRHLIGLGTNGHHSRADIERYVQHAYCQSQHLSEQGLDLEARVIIEMVTSKLLVKHLNDKAHAEQKADTPRQVVYLVSAYNELNRIRPQSQCFTGEDFLRIKIAQLEFLYEGMEQYDWQLVFVDDEAPNPSKQRTIDVIEDMKKDDVFVKRHANKIIALDYDRDLTEERQMYPEELSQLDGSEFAKKSIKAGAIQTGLRYISRCAGNKKAYKTAPPHAIIYTDCDTSVNLGGTGILLNQLETHDVAIGSRRMGNSHVIGKSALRHLQSRGYNLIMRLLFNLQINDTQVGAKAFKPEVIPAIHQHFSAMGMSFDVEVLKLADEQEFTIGEDGIVWIDSELESRSANQGKSMFHGLMEMHHVYFERLRKTRQAEAQQAPEEKDELPPRKPKYKALAKQLMKEPLFNKLIALASNPEWYFIARNAVELYDLVSPREWQAFMANMYLILRDISANKLNPEAFVALCQSAEALVEKLMKSKNFAFIAHEFPQLFDVMELLHINKDYAELIFPMLFGQNVVTKAFFHSNYDFYYDFHQPKIPQESFATWVENGDKDVKPRIAKKPVQRNLPRIRQGKTELSELNHQLKKPIAISLTLFFNMDETSREYATRVLSEKVKALQKEFGDLKNIHWHFQLIDGRKVHKHFSELELCSFMESLNQDSKRIDFDYLKLSGESDAVVQKSQAVQKGMSDNASKADFVGYIDFSDKIDVREMANLVSKAVKEQAAGNDRVVAIGSRRQLHSNIVNKPLTFVLRSQGLNLLVKTLFPSLYQLSDTQTGFKLFSASAWQDIATQNRRSQSLAFDIELLLYARKLGIPVVELPIDFEDGNQDNDADLGGGTISEMLGDALEMAARFANCEQESNDLAAASLFGGGAEHGVYRLTDGSLVKIPLEILDPHYSGVLKHALFKGDQEVAAPTAQERVVSSGMMQRILTNPKVKTLIPSLRQWKAFNFFVMKTISGYENKKNSWEGYRAAQRYGRDLVSPFRFVNEDFYLEIQGERRFFHPQDGVKQTLCAEQLFNDKFKGFIAQHQRKELNEEQLILHLKALIHEGMKLYEQLWTRGLFDLDANLMRDTGYFRTSEGDLRLMVLDPGEFTDDLKQIKDKFAIARDFKKRYDFSELDSILDQLPNIKPDVMGYYAECMQRFYRCIEEDLKRPKKDRTFGCSRYEGHLDYSVVFDYAAHPLPSFSDEEKDTPRQKLADLAHSKVGFHSPYIVAKKPRFSNHYADQTLPFVHLLPQGSAPRFARGLPNEIRAFTEVGSILPTVKALNHCPAFTAGDRTLPIILDAGSATRSSLLKYASAGQTKGNVVVHGSPIYQKIACELSKLAMRFPEGYVILSSSDDLLVFEEQELQAIAQYFLQAEPKPGLYWCDLPEPATHLPMTLEDTKKFLMDSYPFFSKELKAALNEMPMMKGLIQSNDYDTFSLAAQYLLQAAITAERSKEAKEPAEHSPSLPNLPFLTDLYQHYAQYRAMQHLGGIKSPFFMMMTHAFYDDLKMQLLPHIKPYLVNEITWESIVIRGIKCDKFLWELTKPACWPKESWIKVWETMQALKLTHHIDTKNEQQNQARVFQGQWTNFDDPQALIRYLRASTTPVQQSPWTIYADSPLSEEKADSGELLNEKPCELFVANCTGRPYMQLLDSPLPVDVIEGDTVLFYQVAFPETPLTVYRNHLVTTIDGSLYAIPMHPMTKSSLNESMVYQYNEKGEPEPSGLCFKAFAAKQNQALQEMPVGAFLGKKADCVAVKENDEGEALCFV